MRKVNPYTPGAAKRPTAFVGRQRQMALVDSLADQLEGGYPAEDYVFTGLRGMGKTVLLKELIDRLERRGWAAGYYEVRRNDQPEATIAQMVADLAGRSGHTRWVRKTAGQLARRIGSVSLRLDTGAGGPAVTLSVAPSRRPGDPYQDSVAVLTALAGAAQKAGVGAALFVDELQQLRKRDIALMLSISKALEGLPVAFIGAGLPTLPAIIANAGSYAERFSFEVVDRLDTTAAREAIVKPATTHHVTWDPEALTLVLELADRYPHFLQLYGAETWRAAGTPSDKPGFVILPSHVADAKPAVGQRVDQGLYASRYDRASDLERLYLQAMAALGDRDISSGEVARQLGRPLTAAAPIRDRLLKKGLIHAPRSGRLDFSVPGFAEYVRRRAEVDDD